MVQNRLYLFIVMLFFLPACKIDRKPVVDRDKFTFSMSDDSFLFFKNVRQIYYDVQDLPQAKWHAYRYSDRYQSADRPVLAPVIVVDWLRDEAYILIEPNEVLQRESVLTIREKNQSGRNLEYALRERGRENMLEFATKIYEGIMAENDISIKTGNDFLPLFANDDDRENFRIVMSDYYRLTRVF